LGQTTLNHHTRATQRGKWHWDKSNSMLELRFQLLEQAACTLRMWRSDWRVRDKRQQLFFIFLCKKKNPSWLNNINKQTMTKLQLSLKAKVKKFKL
jgi:hypothetical protein